jgi:hypothetical protein
MHIALFICFVLLQAADAYTTWHIVGAGGVERNPLVARAIARFGLVRALALVKVPLVLIVSLAPLPGVVLFLLVALYVAVVANNLHAMR